MKKGSKTELILESIAMGIITIGFILFFVAGSLGFARANDNNDTIMTIAWIGVGGIVAALIGSLMYSTVKHFFDEKRRLSTRLQDSSVSKGSKWYAILSLPIGIVLIGSGVALFFVTKGNKGFLSFCSFQV